VSISQSRGGRGYGGANEEVWPVGPREWSFDVYLNWVLA
jgi:hypothetical protein